MPRDPLPTSFDELVGLIAAVNRAWHGIQSSEAQQELAAALRDKKLGLQIELLRTYPDLVRLTRDDNEGHELYSLRLLRPVRLPGGAVLNDAMHARLDHLHKYLPASAFTQDSE